MASILQFDQAAWFNFALILLRVSALMLTAPVISSGTIPGQIRLYLTLLVTLILFSVLPQYPFSGNINLGQVLLFSAKEVLIGMMLGIVPKVLFATIDFAGAMIGFQMGLSIANVMDPQTNIQVSIISSFKNLVATLLFVVLDGHHIFFEVFAKSYELVPIGGLTFSQPKMDFIIRLVSDIIVIGMKLGAPIIVALLLTNVILGFMARAMPQMNIFVVGFPLTIGLGLAFLIMGMPYFVNALNGLFARFGVMIMQFLASMAR